MILAGEIGATRTRLAAFEADGNQLQQVVEKTYPSQNQPGLPELIANFIQTEGIPVQSACFGVSLGSEMSHNVRYRYSASPAVTNPKDHSRE